MNNNMDIISKLSEFYKVFGDNTRLNILYELLNGGKYVNEISEKLKMRQ